MTPISNQEEDAPDFPISRAVTPTLADVVKGLDELVNQVKTIMEFLIDNGADVNAEDTYGMTPLHHTAIRGNTDALKVLLNSSRIDKEPKDAQGSTPLHLSATYNQPSKGFIFFLLTKFKGPFKSFGYWGLKLLPGIRVIAEGLDLRHRPEP